MLSFREHLGLHDDGPPAPTTRSVFPVSRLALGMGRAHPRLRARYLALDGDEAGRRATKRILPDLRGAAVVPIPEGSDVRSVLQTDGPEALVALS